MYSNPPNKPVTRSTTSSLKQSFASLGSKVRAANTSKKAPKPGAESLSVAAPVKVFKAP